MPEFMLRNKYNLPVENHNILVVKQNVIIENNKITLINSGNLLSSPPATTGTPVAKAPSSSMLNSVRTPQNEITLEITVSEQILDGTTFLIYHKKSEEEENDYVIFEKDFLKTYPVKEELERKSKIPLKLLADALQETLTHPEIHYSRSNTPERKLLASLNDTIERKFILPPGHKYPQIVLIILAGLSSFSMAGIALEPFWFLMALCGGGLFNLIGGAMYPGLEKPWQDTDTWSTATKKFFTSWSSLYTLAGAASAVSPAKLTYNGVTDQGFHPAIGVCAMISNFLLSGTLGTIGVSKVVASIKDFYRGRYSPIVLRETELLIYTLLALILTSARSYSVGKMIYDGDDWAKKLGGFGLATVLNIPETLMFIRAFVELRIKIHQSLEEHHFPSNLLSITSCVLAILFSISFFLSFKGLTSDAWESEYNSWFAAKGQTWLDQIMGYGGGLGAGLLVIGEGSTVEATIKYLYRFTISSSKTIANSGKKILDAFFNSVSKAPISVAPSYYATDYVAINIPETEPLLSPPSQPSQAAPEKTSVMGNPIKINNKDYNFFGTEEGYLILIPKANQWQIETTSGSVVPPTLHAVSAQYGSSYA